MPFGAEDQLARKRAQLERALGRAVDALVPSPRSLGYRARVDLAVGPGGLGYTRPRSREHVPIPACAIARPELNAALGVLQGADLRGLTRLELRTDGQKVVLAAQGSRRELPWGEHVALNGRPLRGDPTVRIQAGGVEHQLSPGTFYQVNLEVNALLVEEVRALALAYQPQAVLDLFAGAGNLSLPLAAAGVPCTLLEMDGPATRDAQATARRLGLPVEVQNRDALQLRAGERFFDLALLDPPRAGAGDLIGRLVLTRPRAIVYVSCNPVALARELRPALAAGYRVRRLLGYDMFPQTPHVEVLCVLERG